MARAKQYADRVNIIKMVKVNGNGRSPASSSATGESSAITSGSMAATNITPKAATTSNGMKRGNGAESPSRATISFSPPPAQNRSSSMP